MKKLVLGALLIGATNLATGCIFVSDDDDPPGDGDGDGDGVGSIELAWELDTECPLPDDTAELVAVDTTTGEMFTDLVNCTDFVNTIDDLAVGTYDVHVNIVSEDRSVVFAISAVEEDVLVTAGDITVVDTFQILMEDAFFAFTWTLTEGGAPLTCDQVPFDDTPCDVDAECADFTGGFCDTVAGVCRGQSTGLDVAATLMTDESLNATTFNCEDGQGVTQPFPLGNYDLIVFSLLREDSEGEGSFIDTDPISDSLEVGNEVVDLGNVEFAF